MEKLLGQSFEAGLFGRAVNAAVMKLSGHRESDMVLPTTRTVGEPLTMTNLRPYFCVLAVGTAISCIALGAECLIHCHRGRKVSLVTPPEKSRQE